MSEAEALTCVQQARDLDEINAAEDAFSAASARGDSAQTLARWRAHIASLCETFKLWHARSPVLRNGTWS